MKNVAQGIYAINYIAGKEGITYLKDLTDELILFLTNLDLDNLTDEQVKEYIRYIKELSLTYTNNSSFIPRNDLSLLSDYDMVRLTIHDIVRHLKKNVGI